MAVCSRFAFESLVEATTYIKYEYDCTSIEQYSIVKEDVAQVLYRSTHDTNSVSKYILWAEYSGVYSVMTWNATVMMKCCEC